MGIRLQLVHGDEVSLAGLKAAICGRMQVSEILNKKQRWVHQNYPSSTHQSSWDGIAKNLEAFITPDPHQDCAVTAEKSLSVRMCVLYKLDFGVEGQ